VKRVLSWALAIVLGASVFYVAYAHLASMLTAKQYFEKPIVTTFENDAALREMFETRGGVVKLQGGEAVFDGKTGNGTLVGFATREIQLTESRVSLRFKVGNDASYDVVLGMEKPGGGHEAVAYVLHDEPGAAHWGWEGEELEPLPGLRSRGLPGEAIDDKGETPFTKEDYGQWHDVELQISTSLRRIAAFVDGVPTGTVFGEWVAGMPVRFVFGVRSRGVADQPIDVRFAKIAVEPRAGAVSSLDFTDRFDGKLIDPRHWAVHSLNSELLSVNLRASKTGLAAVGKATGALSTSAPAFMIDTPEVPLGRVHLEVVLDVRQLHHALFFMGITSALGGPHLRFFDVGLHEDEGKKAFNGTVSGHWGRDGQSRFDPPRKWTTDGHVTLEIDYDAKTRIARAKMNGEVIGEHVSDLQMSEHVRIRFGAVLDDASGAFDFSVRELRLRATTD
jgi:hypothetical protein